MVKNKYLIRLQGEKEWDTIEECQKASYEVLIEHYLQEHPEYYNKAVYYDEYRVLVLEIKDITDKNSALQTFSVDVSYNYKIKEYK